jgi:hypothetical protein
MCKRDKFLEKQCTTNEEIPFRKLFNLQLCLDGYNLKDQCMVSNKGYNLDGNNIPILQKLEKILEPKIIQLITKPG